MDGIRSNDELFSRRVAADRETQRAECKLAWDAHGREHVRDLGVAVIAVAVASRASAGAHAFGFDHWLDKQKTQELVKKLPQQG